jgi:hypothetical protein
MNYKHLSQKQRIAMLSIAEDSGPVEMLRCLGQIIATQHPDLTAGDSLRSRLLAIANELNSTSVETGRVRV